MILFVLLAILIIVVPINVVFVIIGLISKKPIFHKIGCGISILPFLLLLLLYFYRFCFHEKMTVDEDDIYGTYVINTKKCPGKQADWQYKHFRFEIKKDDCLYFYIYDDAGDLKKTIKKPIIFNTGYTSSQIDMQPKENDFHILKNNPTLYREVWSFYYVFESQKFGNMFFSKKKWYSFD